MKNYRRDDLIEIYKTEHERFDNTRNIQWKFNVTAWTLIVLAIHFKSSNIITVDSWTINTIAILLIVGHLLFVVLIQSSLESNKSVWNKIIERLNEYKDKDSIQIDIEKVATAKKWSLKWVTKFGLKDVLWIFFQISITVALLLLFLNIKTNIGAQHC